MEKLNKLIVSLNIVLCIVTFLSYAAAYIDPSKAWPFSFFGTGYFYLLILNSLFILYWLFNKKKNCLISLLVILIGYSNINTYIGTNIGKDKISENALSVMTYNVGGLNFLHARTTKDKEEKGQKIVRFFNRVNKPDILCVQEFGWVKYLSNELGYNNTASNIGVAIYSNLPISNKGKINFKKSNNSAVWADIQTPDGIVRVYNIHLQSNQVSQEAEKLIDQPNINERKTWSGIRRVLAKVKWATTKRITQAKKVAEHIKESPFPVIVCGDFNDTPQSYSYNLISKNLKNGFKEKGRRLGVTYAGSIPALHIDHILASQKMKFESHKIYNVDISDHYPVSAHIRFPPINK